MSYVEGLWSPSLAYDSKKSRQKQMLIASVYFVRRAEESFSLRRGLDSVLRFLQAEHHLSFGIHDRLPERRRRPVGVALDWL
jgi:hypothetical protein